MEPQIEQSLSQRIIRNTIYNIIGRFWGILVTLFLTPYVIQRIGIERFGIWAIIGVITGYFGLLDFGVGTSFVKYISEFYTKRDYEKVNQVINTGFVFYSIFAIFIITLAFFIINPLLTFFKIPAHLYNEALFVFLLGIVLFGISNALSPFGAIQGGLQRMDIANKVGIAISIPMIIGTIFFLESGYGLPGLMVNNAIILVMSIIINVIIAFKILPELRFNPLLFSKEMFRKLFGFGYKLQVVKLGSLAGSQTDKLLITYFLSLGLVTFYQLGSTIVEKVKELSLSIISAFLPAVSELEAKKEIEKIKTLYLKSIRYIILISLPLSFFLIINARLIILTWMNQNFEKAVLSLQILTIAFFINILTGPGAVIAAGIGKPEYQMRVAIMVFLLNLPLSIIFIVKFGFVGVLIGTALTYVISGIYFINLINRELKTSFCESFKHIVLPFLACLVAGFFNHIANRFISLSGIFHERLINFGVLLFVGFIFATIFIAILLQRKFINVEDISLLKRIFSEKSIIRKV